MTRAIIIAAAMCALIPATAWARPNVLLIIADDMGLDASLCYDLGDQQAPMPNVEAMCANGLVFENAYAAPTCSPTRATIMSGQYAFRTGVGAPVAPDGSNALSPDTPSLFDALTPAGYASNIIGKWHLSGRDGFDGPAQFAVSDYFGLYRGGIDDYFNWTAVENGAEVRVEGYSTTVLTDRAIEWIDAQDTPWFLWLAYNAPHAPFHLPPAELHSFDDLQDSAAAVRRNPLPYYQAMLEALDTEIGRLLAAMSAEERANTVVMFIGDNGSPTQVTRGFYGDHAAKGTIYDSGTRVPLIVSGPGVVAGRTEAFVNTTDLHATIAELAGANSNPVDSISFAPALSGQMGARDYVYIEHFTDRETRGRPVYGWAMRQEAYKLINPTGQAAELYNLDADPLEADDLLADGISVDEAEIVARMMARYDAIRAE